MNRLTLIKNECQICEDCNLEYFPTSTYTEIYCPVCNPEDEAEEYSEQDFEEEIEEIY